MKKLLSGLLTIVLFFALITTMVLIGVRGAISASSVEKMYDTFIEDYGFADNTGIEDMDKLNELMEEDEKFKKIFSECFADGLKYTARITDEMPDFEKVLDYIVEETDIEVDEDEMEEAIESAEAELEMQRIDEEDESVVIVKTLFSNSLLIGAILVIGVSVVGICVLTRDVKKGVKRLGINTIITGLLVSGLSSALLNVAENEAIEPAGIVEILISPFSTIGIVSAVIGIVLIILAPKISQTFARINHSNQAIQNLDDSVIKR